MANLLALKEQFTQLYGESPAEIAAYQAPGRVNLIGEHTDYNGGCKLVIGNTNKRRGLVDSSYNERRSECEQAVKALQRQFPELTLLGQMNPKQFNEYKHLIKDETDAKERGMSSKKSIAC